MGVESTDLPRSASYQVTAKAKSFTARLAIALSIDMLDYLLI
jgi:hypothetical protein